MTVSVSSDDESDNFDYLALFKEVAKRYCKAAYNEVAELARKEGVWIPKNTPWNSLRDINTIKEFQTPVRAGRKAEVSTARAIVPIPVSQMASIMMNVDQWATSFFHIVYMGKGKDSNYILERLKGDDDTIEAVVEVHAVYQLPTCHVPTREFRFLRYKKKLPRNGYAIIDISNNYIDPSTRTNSLRKPSGVIIRNHGKDNCEVTWIENVEVDELSENMIYSSIINSNLAFCAQRWINMLLWDLKRGSCTLFDEHVLAMHESARSYLLALTHSMKVFFKECVADKRKPRLLTDISRDEKLKIFVNKTIEGESAYIATTSFQVKAKPGSVFQFLLEKNIELQLLELPTSVEPELCFQFVVTEDNSNSITLHRTRIGEHEKYCLQEVSRDEYCSFIISKPMSAEEVQLHIVSGVESDSEAVRTINVEASGFAIMPDGPGGLESNGSLITFVMQLLYNPASTHRLSRVQIEQDFSTALDGITNEMKERDFLK